MANVVDHACPYCSHAMQITQMSCSACAVSVQAKFPPSRLAMLPLEHQRFIELFVLADGSLKAIAEQTGVSYPTIRSRLDKVVDALRREMGKGRDSTPKMSAGEKAELIKKI